MSLRNLKAMDVFAAGCILAELFTSSSTLEPRQSAGSGSLPPVGPRGCASAWRRSAAAWRARPPSHTHGMRTARAPHACRYTDQLLCTRRRWGFGRAPPEPACFMNSLVAGSFQVRDTYEEQLARKRKFVFDALRELPAKLKAEMRGVR